MSVSTPFCWPWMTRPRRSFSPGRDPMRRWSAVGSAVRAGSAVVPVGAELGEPGVILDVVAQRVVQRRVVAVDVLATIRAKHHAPGSEE